ncbi:hypothetical protein Tco_1194427 [Tanacetum coccineum]
MIPEFGCGRGCGGAEAGWDSGWCEETGGILWTRPWIASLQAWNGNPIDTSTCALPSLPESPVSLKTAE